MEIWSLQDLGIKTDGIGEIDVVTRPDGGKEVSMELSKEAQQIIDAAAERAGISDEELLVRITLKENLPIKC